MQWTLLLPWRWPLWVWLGSLGLAVCIRFPLNFALSTPYLMDFEVYRAVAVRIMESGGAHLYAPTTSDPMVFKYAPCWALLWIPLAWVSSHTGLVIWSTLSALCLLLACWGSLRLAEAAGLTAPPWIMLLVILLISRPLRAEFLNGQVDFLWALLVILFLLAFSQQRSGWAALPLAMAIALKLPALIFVPYLVLRRQVNVAFKTVWMFLAINAVACLALHPSNPLQLAYQWVATLWSSSPGRLFEIGNQSLFALASRWLSADRYAMNVLSLSSTGVLLSGVAISGGLFALVLMNTARRLHPREHMILDAGLLTILMVLCSPTVWIATYSAIILPVTLALCCVITHPRSTWHHIPSLVSLALFTTLTIMTHSTFWKLTGIRYFRGESYVFLVLMVLPWSGVALFAYLHGQRRFFPRHT